MATERYGDNLVKHSLILLLAQQVGNATTVGYQVVMGHTLSTGEYAVLATLLSVILLVVVPASETVRAAVAHFAARLDQDGRRGDVRTLMRQWYGYLTLAAAPIILLSVFGSGYLAAFLHIENPTLLILTGLTLAGSIYLPAFYGALQGIQAFWWVSVVGQSWGAVRLLAGAALILAVGATAMSAVLGQFLAVGVTILLGVWSLRMIFGAEHPRGERIVGSRRYGLVALPILFGFSFLMNMDIIMVRHFLPAESEMYARASQIAKSVVYCSQPIAGALFPKVASIGTATVANWRTLLKALAMAAALIGGLVGLVLLFPGIPLLVLFAEKHPGPELVRMVRYVVLAMSPLGLIFLLMNFELAQHRFLSAYATAVTGCGFIGLVWFGYHHSAWQVVGVLAGATFLCLALLLAGLPWRNRVSDA